MNKPLKKICIAQIIGNSSYGGVPSFVMNYFRHIDRSKVNFFFYTYGDSPIDDEIRALGGKIINMPDVRNIVKCIPFLVKSFKENEIDIVHSHMTSLSITSLFSAALANVKTRVCHAHSTTNRREKVFLIKSFLKPFSKLFATHLVGCSLRSNIWLYGKREGKKAKIITNAINLSSFQVDLNRRSINRKKFGIENKFVIGNIGRFEPQKNHSFLLDAFSKVLTKNTNVFLVLVGSGKLESSVKEKVISLGLEEHVLFLPEKKEVYEYYEIFDIFWLPSLYEGLPLVGVEAQAMGLTCLFSGEISKEIDICNSSIFLPIDNTSIWANTTLELSESTTLHPSNSLIVKEKGYNIQEAAAELLSYYQSILKQ